MAGEKVNKNTRVTKRPEKDSSEPSITMTASQLQEFMKQAYQDAMKQTTSVSSSGKKEIENNLQSTLTSRINSRTKEGKQFDVYLSDPKGPRTRIVIDRIYREYTGSEVTATVNGNTVKVPADGKSHWVHPAHYAAIKAKLQYLSAVKDRANDQRPEIFGEDAGDYQEVKQG